VQVHVAPWIVPIAAPPVREGAVVLDANGVVRAIGSARELARGSDVREHRGVILPGLINAHAHVELSHLGAVAGGEGLVPWVRALLSVRAQGSGDEQAACGRVQAQRLASRGTVAVADISNDGRVAGELRVAGIELVDLHEHIAACELRAPTRPGAVGTAHATYTVGVPALKQLAAASGDRIRSIHVEEDPAEAQYLVEGGGPLALLLAERGAEPMGTPSGRRPVEHLDALGLLGPGTLLVHLTFATPSTLELAASRGVLAVLCPRSNLHITGRLPPFREVRAAGLRTALGTDSLASSPSLDVLGDVQVLARAGADPAWLLAAATEVGALALELPHRGAIAPGRRPGLVVIGDGAHAIDDPLRWVAFEGADAPVERVA
jgi:cytosine/adenosine deaminase-related metal-dependent hydrolase